MVYFTVLFEYVAIVWTWFDLADFWKLVDSVEKPLQFTSMYDIVW